MSEGGSDQRLYELIDKLACDTTFQEFLDQMASDQAFIDQTMREILEKGVDQLWHSRKRRSKS